ncbi:hypothetical protein A3Q56_06920 [Intoshia linei]|uniref:Uncharacterized protein n=1 Tax=Intoshia linei TaxID=1819745 RepID=A0A177ATP1_9BILA|nr:hypothetical protein A3Q56_06920 [Intoshia linei]
MDGNITIDYKYYEKFDDKTIIESINDAVNELLIAKFKNEIITKYIGRYIMNDVVSHFSRKIFIKNNMKLIVLSSPRKYILLLMSLLKIYKRVPNYSSALIIELHKDSYIKSSTEDEYYVKFFYRDTNLKNSTITEYFIDGKIKIIENYEFNNNCHIPRCNAERDEFENEQLPPGPLVVLNKIKCLSPLILDLVIPSADGCTSWSGLVASEDGGEIVKHMCGVLGDKCIQEF